MLYSYNSRLNGIYSYAKISPQQEDKKKTFEKSVLEYCEIHHLKYQPNHLITDDLNENFTQDAAPHLIELLIHLKPGDLFIIEDLSSITTVKEQILEFYDLLEKKGILLIVLNNLEHLSTYPAATTLEEQRLRKKYRLVFLNGYILGFKSATGYHRMNEKKKSFFYKSPGAPRIEVDQTVFEKVYHHWDNNPNFSYAEACTWLEKEGYPYRLNPKTGEKEYTKFNKQTLAEEPLKISKQTFQNMVNRYRETLKIEGNRRDVTGKYTKLARSSHNKCKG